MCLKTRTFVGRLVKYQGTIPPLKVPSLRYLEAPSFSGYSLRPQGLGTTGSLLGPQILTVTL